MCTNYQNFISYVLKMVAVSKFIHLKTKKCTKYKYKIFPCNFFSRSKDNKIIDKKLNFLGHCPEYPRVGYNQNILDF